MRLDWHDFHRSWIKVTLAIGAISLALAAYQYREIGELRTNWDLAAEECRASNDPINCHTEVNRSFVDQNDSMGTRGFVFLLLGVVMFGGGLISLALRPWVASRSRVE